MLLTNVFIVEPESGTVSPQSNILIVDGKIDHVATSLRDPKFFGVRSRNIIDGERRYVVPGFWDMHVHFAEWPPEETLREFLKYGVLGVRENGLGS